MPRENIYIKLSSGQYKSYSPAAMVSPPRRNNTLPMSLLAAKVSIGMARAADDGPDIVLVLKVICTSADVLFVSTLSNRSVRAASCTRLGLPTEGSTLEFSQKPGQSSRPTSAPWQVRLESGGKAQPIRWVSAYRQV
jgi:hypothetical protein